MISTLVSLGAFTGVVLSDQAVHLINAGVTIITGLISIAPAVAYIWGRTWLKGKAVQASNATPANNATWTVTNPPAAETTPSA